MKYQDGTSPKPLLAGNRAVPTLPGSVSRLGFPCRLSVETITIATRRDRRMASYAALTCSAEDETGFVWDIVRGGVLEVCFFLFILFYGDVSHLHGFSGIKRMCCRAWYGQFLRASIHCSGDAESASNPSLAAREGAASNAQCGPRETRFAEVYG